MNSFHLPGDDSDFLHDMDMNMNNEKMKCRLRMAGTIAFAAIALPAGVARAQEQVKSRMFELTYASAVEGIQSLDLRDLEDRAKDTVRE